MQPLSLLRLCRKRAVGATLWSDHFPRSATDYAISVENLRGVVDDVARIDVDGVRLDSPGQGIALRDDGQPHSVKVVMG